MSCPTCSHTLARLGVFDGQSAFLCERCGTAVIRVVGSEVLQVVYVPKLVDRCRQFESFLKAGLASESEWHRLGIEESIRKPEERKA